jgi:CBS domain-containing protein
MKVSDILRVKGGTLYTAQPDEPLAHAAALMAERDIGSLVVMEHGDLVGMLTFRELIQSVVKNGGAIGAMLVRTAMDDAPLTCTMDTEMDEVRRMMLDHADEKGIVTLKVHDDPLPVSTVDDFDPLARRAVGEEPLGPLLAHSKPAVAIVEDDLVHGSSLEVPEITGVCEVVEGVGIEPSWTFRCALDRCSSSPC